MTEVVFPGLSTDRPDAEGVVATWFVADGQPVAAGDLLAEVQVDKVAAEVVAPVGGVVHLLVPEEAAVTQGSPIARIDPSG
jgi:pyruvate/2-oxoglutarate dehydrogenase complex dihydrolipoamide acyltransferase (E2) component